MISCLNKVNRGERDRERDGRGIKREGKGLEEEVMVSSFLCLVIW